MSIKDMWDTIKEYFGDGHVLGSAPMRYNTHICELKHSSTTTNGICAMDSPRYSGVEVSEEAMPLFSVLGDTCAPPCTCYGMTSIVQHIDKFLETTPPDHAEDYTISSGKNDIDVDQVCLYVLRDSLSWWVHWGGPLRPVDYWKHLYVAFAAIPDDIQLPPQAFLDGSFRYLGHTWADCRAGLLSEGVSLDEVEFAEMCLWRQMLTQYLEKVDPELLPLLKSKTMLMTQYRVATANTLGCGALFLASEGIPSNGLDDNNLEIASVAQCMSLDMAKEAVGVLQGEKTETVAGDRVQLKRELRWVYVRCLEYLEAQPGAHVMRRFASAGLHYVPMMDRYLERARGNVRFPIPAATARILEPYVRRPAGAKERLNKEALKACEVNIEKLFAPRLFNGMQELDVQAA